MSIDSIGRKLAMGLVGLGIGYWLFGDGIRGALWGDISTGELRFSYWAGFEDQAMWSGIISDFEAANPGIRVRSEMLPLSGYTAKLGHQFVGGCAPEVMLFQDEPFAAHAAEQFTDLGSMIGGDAELSGWLADCWASAVPSFRAGDIQLGLPVMGGNILVYCNEESFERAERFHGRRIRRPEGGWSLSEFAEICRELTIDFDGDGRADQYGFLQPHWVYYLPFIWSHGADLLDESRSRWTLTGPNASASFAYYSNLRHRWGVSPAPIEYAGQNQDTAFLSGRTAMCVNGPWFQCFLRETRLASRYKVAPIPAGAGGSATRVTWDGICVSRRATGPKRAAAMQFAKFLLSGAAQERIGRQQRAIPARRGSARAFVEAGGGADSPSGAFIRAMETARVQPITRDWQVIHQAMQRHLGSVILDGPGRRTPEEALEALAGDPGIRRAFGGGR